MIADVAILEVDELMSYFDVRQVYTTELGRALATEYDKRVARMIFAAASNTTQPLAKTINAHKTGNSLTLGTDYTGSSATRQAKGDALVNAIFDARVAFEKRTCRLTACMASSPRRLLPYFSIKPCHQRRLQRRRRWKRHHC